MRRRGNSGADLLGTIAGIGIVIAMVLSVL